ncbi:MAG: hypothetical protein EPO24_04880 [Bacteroidetes bacterium]|nr:MAG: hypothetical protein EPO24_04880 [Bacteroidota bacterium]
MKQNGGYATLGFLYREALKVPKVIWKTKTPFATIRRIVQDERFFFKIRPGLWALKEYKNKIPFPLIQPSKKLEHEKDEFNHSYFQGLLIEIGNLKKFETFIPNQDKNKLFLQQSLKDVATLDHFYYFTYDHIIDRAKSIDVTWFNTRKMPQAFFEVEHSTDFKNSLLKFVELQDFNVDFRIVADKTRERQFHSALTFHAFQSIMHRVKFITYDIVSELHTKTVELSLIEQRL